MNQSAQRPSKPQPSRAGSIQIALAVVVVALATANLLEAASPPVKTPWRLSVFQADVTPPMGHPKLAISQGVQHVASVVDPLLAKGLVLHGPAQPIVLVAVDWCELRNDAYARWREVLAQAASTTIDRVLVTCLHQHDAPYFDLTAQKLLTASPGGGTICDLDFHEQAVQRVARALAASLPGARPVTHLGVGKAKVEQVASSRRVVLPGGRVTFDRGSTGTSQLLRDLPEGEIDPWLKTVSFWHDDQPLAEVSSYATHPQSYWGRSGEVSTDFVGMARARREQEAPGVFQIYVAGCSGDVTAGKYNDASKEHRPVLAERLYRAMAEASRSAMRRPVETISCRSVPMLLPHSKIPELQPDALRRQLADPKAALQKRVLAALGLSSIERNPAGHQIDVQMIDFGAAQMVLLPAESFVSYQLLAQRLRPDSVVMSIGYGECAPGYIPTEQAFREGFSGYCWVAPGAEEIIADTLKRALK